MFYRVKSPRRQIDAYRSFAPQVETLGVTGLKAVITNEHGSLLSQFTFASEAEYREYVEAGGWIAGNGDNA